MKNLISMRTLTLEIEEYVRESHNEKRACEIMFNYANFLSRQPKLGDFIPCGKDGFPLEKPKEHLENRTLYYQELEAYQKALDKVLFKGFEVCNDNEEFTRLKLNNDVLFFITFYKESEMIVSNPSGGNQQYITTLEHLTPYNLELTENGNKIIGV